MSFYRIYRPQVIDEMDNAEVRAHLSSLLSKNRSELPHAFLFTGPRGTGKTTAARLVAKLFNCEKLGKSGPCGECSSCTSIATGNNIDVLEIDAASNRGIDEMRELRARISLAPAHGIYKVYIIDEVHMLTTEAFNALLKTLEEPPLHAIFVLATTDPQKIPDTIISRCMHLSFARATHDELVHVLERIAKTEKVSIDADAIVQIARVADGSFRDAAKLLEQISFIGGKITLPVVQQALTISDGSIRENFLVHLVEQDVKKALEDISLLVADGKDIKSFIVDVLGDVEKMLVKTAGGEKVDFWTAESLTRAIAALSKSFMELKYTPIEQLPLELAVIDYCRGEGVEPKEPEKIVPTVPKPKETVVPQVVSAPKELVVEPLGLLTIEKLTEHWADVISYAKPYNHSVAGVLRSARPKAVGGGIVTIEAFYKFHQEKLSEMNNRQMLSDLFKKLFGEKVKVEIVLGKK